MLEQEDFSVILSEHCLPPYRNNKDTYWPFKKQCLLQGSASQMRVTPIPCFISLGPEVRLKSWPAHREKIRRKIMKFPIIKWEGKCKKSSENILLCRLLRSVQRKPSQSLIGWMAEWPSWAANQNSSYIIPCFVFHSLFFCGKTLVG